MKYLEKFNWFKKVKKEESILPILYTKKTFQEEVKFSEEHDLEDFTNSEINKLKKIVSKIDYGKYNRKGRKEEMGVKSQTYFHYKYFYYTVDKYKDEWFFVSKLNDTSIIHQKWKGNQFFICDTLDGVIQLINGISKKVNENKFNDYYQDIDENEYETNDRSYYFTPNEVSQLNSILYGSFVNILYSHKLNIRYKGAAFFITGNKDEYFFIHSIEKYSSRFYKCDQFSGVLKFFEDVKRLIDKDKGYPFFE